jgi:hypothetical protein
MGVMATGFSFGHDHWKHLTRQLDEVIRLGKEQLEVNRAILKALQHPTEVVAFKFKTGVNMPLLIPATDQPDQGFVTLTVNGTAVNVIPSGQTIQLVSADPATFTIAQDATTVADPDGTVVAASFLVTPINPPAQPNVAVNATLNILNADGTVAATVTDTVTVSTNPAVTEVVGVLFEAPIAAPASAKK